MSPCWHEAEEGRKGFTGLVAQPVEDDTRGCSHVVNQPPTMDLASSEVDKGVFASHL